MISIIVGSVTDPTLSCYLSLSSCMMLLQCFSFVDFSQLSLFIFCG